MGLEKLNEFKKKKGLTNAQLSEMTGITISTIDKITSGNNTNPKLRTIEALCQALDCSLNDVVESGTSKNVFDNTNDKKDTKKELLIKNYEQLNENGKNELVRYSDFMLGNSDYLKENNQIIQGLKNA